jgi:hypothetical protein
VNVELPLGDIVDKVTILLLKEKYLFELEALANVSRELLTLRGSWKRAGYPAMETLEEWADLREVNHALWRVEDDLRDCERVAEFGPQFVTLARSVYQLNDKRASLKRAINTTLGSRLVEEKSYASYAS